MPANKINDLTKGKILYVKISDALSVLIAARHISNSADLTTNNRRINETFSIFHALGMDEPEQASRPGIIHSVRIILHEWQKSFPLRKIVNKNCKREAPLRNQMSGGV